MKKYKIIIVLTILVSLGFSCSDDFFKKEPQGALIESSFYSQKGIDALLIGAYSMVRGSSEWEVSWGASIENWTYGNTAADDCYKGSELSDQTPANDIERWEVQPSNSYIADKWKLNIGMGVPRVNTVLKVINQCETDSKITAAQATAYRAEAKFLRGLFYFEARLVFGDYLPIFTEDTVDPSKVTNVNADGAVLTQIISDLKYAYENLPATQSEVGRPTKYAAMALAARAYLQDLKYSEAKTLLDNVINSGVYSLVPKFIQNFNIATNNNAESIFEIQSNVNDVDGSLNGELGIGLNWPHGGDIGMCCGFHQPSQNLVNAFKVDANGLPLFDTFNTTDFKNDQGVSSSDEFIPDETTPVDPRLDFTVSRRGIVYKDWGVNRGADWIRNQPNGGPYLPCPKPFFKKAELNSLSTTTGWQTGINANNYRYIRYAHVLLWRAEVAAYEGDLTTAKDLVNQIRSRAGNDKLMGKFSLYVLNAGLKLNGDDENWKTYTDFTQPAANYKIGLYTSFASKKEAMRAVQWEDRLEFATEGIRFFDLRRWDNLSSDLKGESMVTILNNYATADQRIRTFMKGATFTETDKYWPVPQTQLDLEPGVLEQRPEFK